MPLSAATLFVALLLLTGVPTSSTSDPFSHSTTPKAWTRSGFWQFHIVDTDRKWLGAMVLELTTSPTETCTDGDWKVANLVRASTTFFKLRGNSLTLTKGEVAVAFSIVGDKLAVDLNANVCDNNYFLYGELRDSGAAGRVRHTGIPPELTEIGWFTAAPVYSP